MIAPSQYMKSVLEKNQVKGNLVVMPNFVPEWSQSSASRIYEFPYFLYVGVLERHKGVMDLVNTFIEIRHSVRANLLLVGRGSLENEIKETIKKSGCEKNILLLGYLAEPELANLYKQASAVMIPSAWHENCPLVGLEALASGTPLIVSNNGGLPELVTEPELGFVYTNREELKSILTEFSKDEFNPNIIKKAHAARYSPSGYVQNLLKHIAQAGGLVKATQI
jgi:glycosyltransferase involved in cell wall biosynthesis